LFMAKNVLANIFEKSKHDALAWVAELSLFLGFISARFRTNRDIIETVHGCY